MSESDKRRVVQIYPSHPVKKIQAGGYNLLGTLQIATPKLKDFTELALL